MKEILKKSVAVILTVAMATVMTAPTGVFASSKDAVVDAAKQAGVDVKSKEEVEAFSDALEEAGIDIADVDIEVPDKGKKVPVVTPGSGKAAGIDEVPAAAVEDTISDTGKKTAGFSAQSIDDFGDLTDEIRNNCADINVGENVDNKYVTQVSKETITYRFTAPRSGTVAFWSTGTADTCGRALDSGGQEICSNDDVDDDRNFRVYFDVTGGDTYYLQAIEYNGKVGEEINVHLMYDEYSATINASLNKSTGMATVTGTATGDTFEGIYVDGYKTGNNINGRSTFSAVVDMKNYDVGYHTISAKLKNHGTNVTYRYAVPTHIYGTPSIGVSNFTTGKNYLVYYNGNTYSRDSSCSVFFDFKKKGGKWNNNYGPVARYSSGKKTKLKANSWYYVRVHYGKLLTYNGKKYFFTGKDTGKKSKAVRVKTGKAKKPDVKSIKITNAKQFKKTYTYTTWIYTYGYAYPIYRHYTQWYTSFKVTVTMKKKPGTAGIYIGTKRLKGNKKTYKANFTVVGKQKGKKLKVAVYSYQNPTYKGYSPVRYKKVKVK